jgi:hypothetical protein
VKAPHVQVVRSVPRNVEPLLQTLGYPRDSLLELGNSPPAPSLTLLRTSPKPKRIARALTVSSAAL